jgi:hypothetical protein
MRNIVSFLALLLLIFIIVQYFIPKNKVSSSLHHQSVQENFSNKTSNDSKEFSIKNSLMHLYTHNKAQFGLLISSLLAIFAVIFVYIYFKRL